MLVKEYVEILSMFEGWLEVVYIDEEYGLYHKSGYLVVELLHALDYAQEHDAEYTAEVFGDGREMTTEYIESVKYVNKQEEVHVYMKEVW